MSTPEVKTDVIEADVHVVETERVWDYLEPTEGKYCPTLMGPREVRNSLARENKEEAKTPAGGREARLSTSRSRCR